MSQKSLENNESLLINVFHSVYLKFDFFERPKKPLSLRSKWNRRQPREVKKWIHIRHRTRFLPSNNEVSKQTIGRTTSPEFKRGETSMTSIISNLNVIPIHWCLIVDSEMAFCFLVRLVRLCLFLKVNHLWSWLELRGHPRACRASVSRGQTETIHASPLYLPNIQQSHLVANLVFTEVRIIMPCVTRPYCPVLRIRVS